MKTCRYSTLTPINIHMYKYKHFTATYLFCRIIFTKDTFSFLFHVKEFNPSL